MTSLLNAPVGYTKNPVEPRPRTCSPSTSYAVSLPPPSRPMLHWLNRELCSQIAFFLNQHDTLSFALTCKDVASASLPRLYHKVVVDADYTEFRKEYDVPCTYIKLLYSFKKLVSRYTGKYPIHVFVVAKLPDTMKTFDEKVVGHLLHFFPTLHHLHTLHWLLDNFSLEYLRLLPSPEVVRELRLNLNQREQTREFVPFAFTNLTHFHARPFDDMKRLANLVNDVLCCADVDSLGHTLQSLKLSRHGLSEEICPLHSRHLDRIFREEAAWHAQHSLFQGLRNIYCLFNHTKLHNVRLALTELCLDDLFVYRADAEVLAKATDLTVLRKLELRNIHEFAQWSYEPEVPSFLQSLAPLVTELTHLRLDYRETRRDSVPSMLASCQNLVELDLVIKLNDVKNQYVDPEELYLEYAQRLRELTQLVKLLVELNEERPFGDVSLCTPVQIIQSIGRMPNLRFLRLNPTDSGQSLKQFLHILKRLTRLEILDVFGTRAGGAPHMALGTTHPNIYDEWLKVQHVAFLFGDRQDLLRYVRINKCVFEYTDTAEPRDEIDRWFDAQVRVGE